MTQTTMPSPSGWSTDTTSLLMTLCSCLLRPQWIETALTLAAVKGFLRSPILYEKIVRMKFNESVIVGCEMMYRNKTFVCTWNMKNIL